MKKLVDAALVFILVVGLAYMVYLSRSDGSLFGTPTPTITFTATSTPAPSTSGFIARTWYMPFKSAIKRCRSQRPWSILNG